MHPFDPTQLLRQATPWIVAGFLYGQLFAWLYAAARVGYCRATGRPWPHNRALLALDALVEMVPNSPGAINKVYLLLGLPPLMLPSLPLPRPRPGAVKAADIAVTASSSAITAPFAGQDVSHPDAALAASGDEP